MALNFPNSPSLNDLHEENLTKWRWNGSSWIRVVTTSTAGAQGFQGAAGAQGATAAAGAQGCLLYTSPSPRDKRQSRMPSSA